MIKLNLSILCFILFTLSGCTSNKENESDKKIIGIWQNNNEQGIAIEFDKNGFYHLLSKNKRLTFDDSANIQYYYSKESNNLIIEEQSNNIRYEGVLTFIDDNNISISLNSGNQNLKRNYSRINNAL